MVTVGYIQGIFAHRSTALAAEAQVLTSRHDDAGAGVASMGSALSFFNEPDVGRVTVAPGVRVVAVPNGDWRRAVSWLLGTRKDPLELGAVSLPRGVRVSDDEIEQLAASSVVVVTNEDRDTAAGADQFAREFIERSRAATDHVFEFLAHGHAPEPNEDARPRRSLRLR